ncbi:putative GNAT family acetyltransferase [Streptacidiphilus sp. MAP12-20]|uniref:GNAT family N-acetyltransferase n=1 Tax=Streptacidiphilus sp. MAP12-20 TaxID=3156299 RepID=UPI0035156E56
MSTSETEAEVTVADVPEAQRFEARIEGDLVGFASYVRDDERVIYQHTVVGPAYEGLGIGGLLARAAIEDGIGRGIKVKATCPFIKAWLTRHPEYQDKLSGTPGV